MKIQNNETLWIEMTLYQHAQINKFLREHNILCDGSVDFGLIVDVRLTLNGFKIGLIKDIKKWAKIAKELDK